MQLPSYTSVFIIPQLLFVNKCHPPHVTFLFALSRNENFFTTDCINSTLNHPETQSETTSLSLGVKEPFSYLPLKSSFLSAAPLVLSYENSTMFNQSLNVKKGDLNGSCE